MLQAQIALGHLQATLGHLQAALIALQAATQTFEVDVTIDNIIAIIEDVETCVKQAQGG